MPRNKRKKKIDIFNELNELLTLSFIILVLLLTILNLQKRPLENRVLGINTEINKTELIQEKEYWDDFLAKHPTYIDGWERMSEIEFMLGDYNSSEKSIEVANRINPNR